MESTIRNVREIASDERRVYETVLGQRLKENQQVVLQVIDLGESYTDEGDAQKSTLPPCGLLPDWCRVYEGLTEQQVAEIEDIVLARTDMTRPSP